MSAISTDINKIRNAVWADEVRESIAHGIEQCYSDVSNPTLQTDALEVALQAKIDEGEMAALMIGDGTITTAKIANGAITRAKLDPNISFEADGELDATSTNAIQNKVVAQAIGEVNESLEENVYVETRNLFEGTLTFNTDFYGPEGETSAGSTNVCVGYVDVLPETTYTVSCSFTSSSERYLRVNELDANDAFIARHTVHTLSAGRYGVTFTTDSNTTKLQLAPNANTRNSTSGLNVQVELGENYTDYIEHIIPLYQKVDAIESDISGIGSITEKQDKALNRNLFDGVLNFYEDFYGPSGTISTGSNDVCVGYVDVLPNTLYTLSWSYGSGGPIMRVNELDKNGAFIARTVSNTSSGANRYSQTIRTTANTVKLQLAPNRYSTVGGSAGLNVQVEKGSAATEYIPGTLVETELANIKREFVTVYIAASNASEQSKKYADYVCTGVHDETVINNALYDHAATGCTIKLSEGEFVIDAFGQDTSVVPTAILFPTGDVRTTFNIIGTGIPGVLIADGNTPGSGMFTKLKISDTCYDALDSDTPVSLFRCKNKKVKFNISNMGIHAKSNSKPITYINGFNSGNLNLKDIWIWNDDYASAPTPNEQCYGVVGTKGSNLGISYEWSRVDVYGCYEAFRISGEHLILRQCLGRFGVYAYTFGVVENTEGACTHPTTLINCGDECNARMPLFGFNGEHGDRADEEGGNQAITFIDYNMEWGNNYVPNVERAYATEMTPGMFKGRIEYTIQAGWGGANSKTIPFWEPGHGRGFVSRNQAQDLAGTTTERLSYSSRNAANYMQMFYDTDLNKMVLYDGTKWVDMNGTAVDA